MLRSHGRRIQVPAVAIILAACGSGGTPAVDVQAETQALRQASDQLTAAEVAHDAAGAVEFYAADVVIQPANAPAAAGKASVAKEYEEFFATPGLGPISSTRTGIAVAQSGDMGWEHGINRITVNGKEASGKYLAVWKKVDGAWKVAALSMSDDAPPPPPPPASPARK
jgi:ketosteroid isomerase-like protein